MSTDKRAEKRCLGEQVNERGRQGIEVQQGILEVECKPRGLRCQGKKEVFQGEECF